MTDDAALAAFARLLEKDFASVVEGLRDPGGKIVLNADDLFRLSEAYRNEPAARMRLGPILYTTARRFTDRAYEFLLSRPHQGDDLLVFTAGGAASGKSSALRAQHNREKVDFIVDTTFSTPERALAQVDQALAADRRVAINYVYRPFVDSVIGMLERALDPTNRRVVPIDDMARTHVGSQLSVGAATARYDQALSESRVAIHLWENVGRNKVAIISRAIFAQKMHPSVDELAQVGQNILDEISQGQCRKWEHEPIPQALYEAATSRARADG